MPAPKSIRPRSVISACTVSPRNLRTAPKAAVQAASRLHERGDLEWHLCGCSVAAAVVSCTTVALSKRSTTQISRRRRLSLPTIMHKQTNGMLVMRESAILADRAATSEDAVVSLPTMEQLHQPLAEWYALMDPLRDGRLWEDLIKEAWFSLRFGVVSAAFDFLDSVQGVGASTQWATELNGAFHPVSSPVRETSLTVKSGSLPLDVSGAFLRVGPNPAIWPPKKRTHVFDGDGMVHTVRISGGKAVYSCAFMETERWKFEQQLGAEWFLRIGELQGLSGLAKMVLCTLTENKLTGLRVFEMSTANTAIALTPEGKLWALNEAGLPFRFQLDEVGCPTSIGFDTLEGTLKGNMSAHPKFDKRTGETFFHASSAASESPFCVCRIIDGVLTDRVELPMHAGFHHDLFITEKYVVVVDGSMRFEPSAILDGEPLWMFEPKRKLRFGLWPRTSGKMSADDFVWIDSTEAAEIVHTMHAYDDDDGKVVLWAPVGRELQGSRSVILGDCGPCQMHRIVIDVAASSVDIHSVPGSQLRTEFPRIRDDRAGHRVRYGYSALQGAGDCEFNLVGIAKWDFEIGGLAETIHFPEGVVGGEPIFVPSATPQPCDGDDAGYIGMFLWDSRNCESTFVLYDARTMAAEPVVEMHVPRRVPMGFHALWVSEDEL